MKRRASASATRRRTSTQMSLASSSRTTLSAIASPSLSLGLWRSMARYIFSVSCFARLTGRSLRRSQSSLALWPLRCTPPAFSGACVLDNRAPCWINVDRIGSLSSPGQGSTAQLVKDGLSATQTDSIMPGRGLESCITEGRAPGGCGTFACFVVLDCARWCQVQRAPRGIS